MALFSTLAVLAIALISHIHCTEIECAGTEQFLDGQNVLEFGACERVTGNLIINQHSTASDIPLTYNKLLLLNNIREIGGYLSIDGLNHTHITDLRFLRRLEVIRGEQTLQLFGRQDYALVIQNNPYLLTLNLASLNRIVNGGVRVTANPSLCLVDTIAVESYLVNSGLSRVGGLGQDCSNVYCHDQCEQSRGCWGVYPDECVMCRGYQFMDSCVHTCNLSLSYSVEDSTQCLPLTTLTTTTATPPAPSHTPMPEPATTTATNTTHYMNSMRDANISMPTSPNASTTEEIDDETTFHTSHLVLTSVGSFAAFIVFLLLLLLAGCSYHQAKTRKGRKASLLLTRQPKHKSLDPYEGEERSALIPATTASSGDSNPSTRVLRGRSRISLSSISSRSKVQEYENMECETVTAEQQPFPRRLATPPLMTVAPETRVLQSRADTVATESQEASSHPRVSTGSPSHPRVSTGSPSHPRVSPAGSQPRISFLSDADSGCFDTGTNLTQPDLNPSSHDNHMMTTTVTNSGAFQGAIYDSEDTICPPRPPSTSSWKLPLSISPALQRPMTMGGVYSTGNHPPPPQHHRNRSHGNSSHRDSLTSSSYGTGASSRTSGRTSRSTSQQAGAIMGCGSAVLAARQSKTPLQSQVADKPQSQEADKPQANYA